jgi:cytochrome c553
MAGKLKTGLVLLLMVSAAVLAGPPPTDDPPPEWAFWQEQPLKQALPETRLTVPGSKLTITRKQFDDLIGSLDWFPSDHPAMPVAVGKGRAPHQFACGLCHLPNGIGYPASADLAGLPAAYIVQQIGEFKSGRRNCAGKPKTSCLNDMKSVVAKLSPEDIREAAAYFAALPWRRAVKIVETDTAPKIEVFGYQLAASKDSVREPIGQRILELPDNPMDTYLADSHAKTTTYVPTGSLARGKALVESSQGRAPCTSCHGPKLQGVGDIPPLAGQRPTYLYRQLYDIEYGYRSGPTVAPMQPEVAGLTNQDRVAIAAYLASLDRDAD